MTITSAPPKVTAVDRQIQVLMAGQAQEKATISITDLVQQTAIDILANIDLKQIVFTRGTGRRSTARTGGIRISRRTRPGQRPGPHRLVRRLRPRRSLAPPGLRAHAPTPTLPPSRGGGIVAAVVAFHRILRDVSLVLFPSLLPHLGGRVAVGALPRDVSQNTAAMREPYGARKVCPPGGCRR